MLTAAHERELVFDSFDEADAWAIGSCLRDWGMARGWPIMIDIRTFDRPLLVVALPGATADNVDWVRRKGNVVQRFQCSSATMRERLAAGSITLAEKYGLDHRDYAASGGSVPLRVRWCPGAIGSVTVSGLRQDDDHRIVVKAIATRLGLNWADDIDLPA